MNTSDLASESKEKSSITQYLTGDAKDGAATSQALYEPVLKPTATGLTLSKILPLSINGIMKKPINSRRAVRREPNYRVVNHR